MRVLTAEPRTVRDSEGEWPRGREEGSWFYDRDTGRLYVLLGADREHDLTVVMMQ